MSFSLRPLHIALQPDNTIHYLNGQGMVEVITPGHPKYQDYLDYLRQANPAGMRLFGALMALAGLVGWWYPWQVLLSGGASPRAMALVGPFFTGLGLTALLWPRAVYQVDVESQRRRRIADCAKLVFILLLCALNLYLTETLR